MAVTWLEILWSQKYKDNALADRSALSTMMDSANPALDPRWI